MISRAWAIAILAAAAVSGCGPAVESAKVKGSSDAEIGRGAEIPGVALEKAEGLEPPSAEAAAATTSRGDGVFVKGDLVFRGASGGLVIGFMEEGGKKVLRRGVAYLPDASSDVVVIGDVAYVATGPRGVVLVDVSDPSSPEVRGRITTPGAALRLFPDGDRLLVANGSAGVLLLDVREPSSPAALAAWKSEGYVRHAVLSGDDVYVAEGRSGVSRLRFCEGGFEHVWRHDTGGQARGISINGQVAAIANGPSGLLMMDIGKEIPGSLGSLPLEDMARDALFSADGSRVFVATGDDGIAVADVTDPAAPKRSGEFLTDKPTNRLRADGERLCVGNDSAGLLLLDVSDPDSPEKIYPPLEE